MLFGFLFTRSAQLKKNITVFNIYFTHCFDCIIEIPINLLMLRLFRSGSAQMARCRALVLIKAAEWCDEGPWMVQCRSQDGIIEFNSLFDHQIEQHVFEQI